ncbi:hypothetical protein FQN51_003349 [Onygenales sp. PD_10]|nr:hypothetical protein FQN51_003349 [Onygenales sp. PD_10]
MGSLLSFAEDWRSIARSQPPQFEFDPSIPNTSTAPALLAVIGVSTGIAALVVAFRTYIRLVVLNRMGLDDYAIHITMLSSLGCFASIIGQTSNGLGRHPQYVAQEKYMTQQKFSLAQAVLIVLGLGTVKISIALFLLRVVTYASRKMRRFLWFMIGEDSSVPNVQKNPPNTTDITPEGI